jgi:hypothetical protein
MNIMDSPEHELRHVMECMKSQAPDETVEHAEKVAAERLLTEEYSVWDVHTDKARWWVIHPGPNLYSQKRFKSMKEALSLHAGLLLRMRVKEVLKAPDRRPRPRLERTWRQWEQAAEAQVEADEAEEFQAIGVRCRETLLSFVQEMAAEMILPEGQKPPPASDFIHWSERIVDALASGASAAELRGYLKVTSKAIWKYVSWLTHAKNAARHDGEMAVEMVFQLLAHFEHTIERKERCGPFRCPSCSSYRVVRDQEFDFENDTVVRRRLCEVCEWREEYEPEPLEPQPPPREPPEGECVVAP